MKQQASLLQSAFFMFLVTAFGVVSLAQAQPAPSQAEQLAEAEEAYDVENYEKALTTANQLLDQENLAMTERMRAYRLKGLGHASRGQQAATREAVQEMIYISPSYEPATDAPVLFVEEVNEAKSLHAQQALPMQQKEEDSSNHIFGYIAGGLSTAILGFGMFDLFMN